MFKFEFGYERKGLRLMCLGAHSEDLEIGCVAPCWSGSPHTRRSKSPGSYSVLRDSANELLSNSKRTDLVQRNFRDGYFLVQFDKAKSLFEEFKASENPNVILTHRLEDRHHDHRLVAELTWQTFLDHLILEYEIPKYESDLGQSNFCVALSNSPGERKVKHLLRHFGSHRAKNWFRSETFLSLMQVRGIECRAPSGISEGSHVRKATI